MKGIKVYFDKIQTASLSTEFPVTRSHTPEKRGTQPHGRETFKTRKIQISYFLKNKTR